jgi:hypothetical protein
MTSPNMNGKDFTIGVLSVTAVVLFVGLVILNHASPPQAMAFGQGGTAGDYVVSTAQLDNTTDVIFVTDTVAQEMNMYGFNPALGVIDLVQKFDLRALQVLNQPPPPGEAPNRRGREGARAVPRRGL